MSDKKSVAVVGAGISGLCVAYWLQQQGYEVTVLEQSGHIGGSIVTEKQDGYLLDLGPNSTLETSEMLKALVDDIGLGEQKVYGNEASNKRYILKNGNLLQVPMSPGLFLKTRLFSTGAKLRLLKEPFIRKTSGEDLSLAEFVRYRLGDEFLDYAINPFVAGVYAGDPDNLSTAAGFPKLYALEQKYGSLIKGAIQGARERKKRKEVAKDRAKLFSFREGMQVFPKTLAEHIGHSNIRLNTKVKDFRSNEDGFDVRMVRDGDTKIQRYHKVVLAVPADALSEMVTSVSQAHIEPIAGIQYPPVAVVFTGFKSTDVGRPLDGFGFLIPAKEKRRILGSIWSSTIFPGRAPEDRVAFTTFVGGTRQPELALLSDQEIRELVIDELRDIMGTRAYPEMIRIKKWPRAIPQYAVGYKKIQEIFDRIEHEQPGCYIAGNIRSGISVGDSVLCAHETVQKVLQR
jgi:oxygen-dependent protoporphyrinogen oxidase